MASTSASVAIAAVGMLDVRQRERATVARGRHPGMAECHPRIFTLPFEPLPRDMTDAPAATLKRTPLHDIHVALGGKIVPFAGYEMPVQYTGGITAEHRAVREGCGIFDVSHMGEFWVTGDRAVEFVNHVTTNDVAALAVGQVHYSTILNDRGTIEDDCLVYRFADKLMMVVNASNVQKDFAAIAKHADEFGVKLVDVSDSMGLLALQGPRAATILQALTKTDLSQI